MVMSAWQREMIGPLSPRSAICTVPVNNIIVKFVNNCSFRVEAAVVCQSRQMTDFAGGNFVLFLTFLRLLLSLGRDGVRGKLAPSSCDFMAARVCLHRSLASTCLHFF